MNEKELAFEEAMALLEKTVKDLETGDLTLDELLSSFEKGIGLVNYCHQKLNAVEKKVEVLLNGKLSEMKGTET